MKVKYTSEDPTEKEVTTFDSIQDFLKEHNEFTQFFSRGREKWEQTVIINVPDYPIRITIELKKEI
jgi:hypothetical protein